MIQNNDNKHFIDRGIPVKFELHLSRTQRADLKCSSSLLSSPRSKQKISGGRSK